MSFLIKLPVTSNNVGLVVIPESDIVPIGLIGLDFSAYGHWILQGSETSFVSKVNTNELTATDGYTFAANKITISGDTGKQLDTDIDKYAGESTSIVMFASLGAGVQMIEGNFTANPGIEGSSAFLSGGSLSYSNGNTLSTGLPVGQWRFLSISRSYSGGNETAVIRYSDGLGGLVKTTIVQAHTNNVNNLLAIGNPSWDNQTPIDVAEYLVYNTDISQNDEKIQNIFDSMVSRQALYGNALV